MELILEWTSFENIGNLNYSNNNLKSGIYLWGFKFSNKFIPYYLGSSENIEYRLFEHVNSIISGKYTIFHKDDLHRFYNFKDDLQNDISKKGMIYRPDWPKNYNYFLNHRNELQSHIDFMVDNFVFSYSVIKENLEKTELKLIENKCINSIGMNLLINTRSGKSENIFLQHLGNQKIIEIFNKTNK
jgi:hypothetical protein